MYKSQQLEVRRVKIDATSYRIEGTYTIIQRDNKDVSVPLIGSMGKGNQNDGVW